MRPAFDAKLRMNSFGMRFCCIDGDEKLLTDFLPRHTLRNKLEN
ncbi:hypothetical protein CLJ1_5858 [Pseudomonas paraeruginosa]|nr:hypothetical protein CLJ1_5858 [Pseudomonas aeruginosa]